LPSLLGKQEGDWYRQDEGDQLQAKRLLATRRCEEATPAVDGSAQQPFHGSATQPAPGQHVSPSARGSRLPSSNNANGGNSLRLGRANSRRPGAYLDRSSRLERFAVEIEHHDLVLDHALHEERAVVLAPGEPLTPVADFGLGQRDQFVAFYAQHLH